MGKEGTGGREQVQNEVTRPNPQVQETMITPGPGRTEVSLAQTGRAGAQFSCAV